MDWQDNLYATPYWTQPTATRCERCAQSSSQQAAVLARGLDGGTLPHLLRPGGGSPKRAVWAGKVYRDRLSTTRGRLWTDLNAYFSIHTINHSKQVISLKKMGLKT